MKTKLQQKNLEGCRTTGGKKSKRQGCCVSGFWYSVAINKESIIWRKFVDALLIVCYVSNGTSSSEEAYLLLLDSALQKKKEHTREKMQVLL
jgi:hypothetical protein